jgi:hypothetical protein
MVKLRMPGFTAEASLDPVNSYYVNQSSLRVVATSSTSRVVEAQRNPVTDFICNGACNLCFDLGGYEPISCDICWNCIFGDWGF